MGSSFENRAVVLAGASTGACLFAIVAPSVTPLTQAFAEAKEREREKSSQRLPRVLSYPIRKACNISHLNDPDWWPGDSLLREYCYLDPPSCRVLR